MKKVLQLSALLFALALVVAVAPAAQPSFHSHASIVAAVAQAQQPDATPQAQQQQPDTAAPQTQQPNQAAPDQDPNANPNAPMRHHGRLPRTASPLPLLGLIGLFCIVGIVVLRRLRHVLS